MLSRRSRVFINEPEFLLTKLKECGSDPFDPEDNPDGFVNCGTAVNHLTEDLLEKWLHSENPFEHCREWQHYTDLVGHEDIKKTVANFLSMRLEGVKQLDPKNIRVMKGVTVCIETLAFVLCDPGDVVLLPCPTYGRFFNDLTERAEVNVVRIQLTERPESGETRPFELTAERLEREILRQKDLGRRVKAFVHCNPNNPLGVVYPGSLTRRLMEVCAKHEVHFICDEIYAMSVFGDAAHHESILSMEGIPDPERTHFMWGMSKDFGFAGLRFGVVYSWNKEVLQCIDGMGLYVGVPPHIQAITGKMLQDEHWYDNVFRPTTIKRLKESHAKTTKALESMGIKVLPSEAGLFIWADFSKYMKAKTFEEERKLFDKIFSEGKVYIVPGGKCFSVDPGWFRIIHALHPSHINEAMKRLKVVLEGQQNCSENFSDNAVITLNLPG